MKKAKKQKCLFLLLAALIIIPRGALAQDPEDSRRIVIDIPKYTLTLCQGENVLKQYPIAVGRPTAATPVGSYRVYNRAVNPTWHPNSSDPVPPGPDNPLGIRWMGFYRGYGIHGNNNPQSIGKSISAGCIRMFNYDVSELYSTVGIGVPVEVRYADLIEMVEENAVIAYRDIYSREKDYRDEIVKMLDTLGVSARIAPEKLKNLFSAVNRKTVVFSPNWVLKVNGEFLTADTIYDRSMVFVNADQLNRLFGADIRWDSENNTGRLSDSPVSAYLVDGVLYASIADVVGIIGGKLLSDNSIEELDLAINFAKLDGKFLTSEIENFETDPMIEYGLVDPSMNGKVGIDYLKRMGFDCQVYSKYGYIEILRNLP